MEKKTASLEVIYEVEILTDIPLNIFVSYTDSTGYKTFYTDEKKWSEKVTLKPWQMASLLVSVSYNWESFPERSSIYYWSYDEKQRRTIRTSIIHPKRKVEGFGGNVVHITCK